MYRASGVGQARFRSEPGNSKVLTIATKLICESETITTWLLSGSNLVVEINILG